jgi:hypothetical protein
MTGIGDRAIGSSAKLDFADHPIADRRFQDYLSLSASIPMLMA